MSPDFNCRLKPVQRICKYPLLIKEIIKNTDPQHPDYENLQKALLKIETVVTIVNEGARKAESVHKMLEIQGKLTSKMPIIAPSRLLVRNGPADLITASNEKKKREIYLFNDLLLLVKPVDEKLKPIASVPFDTMLINALPDAPGKENIVEIVHVGNAKFSLQFDCSFTKQQWLKIFASTTEEWVKATAKHQEIGLGGDIDGFIISQHDVVPPGKHDKDAKEPNSSIKNTSPKGSNKNIGLAEISIKPPTQRYEIKPAAPALVPLSPRPPLPPKHAKSQSCPPFEQPTFERASSFRKITEASGSVDSLNSGGSETPTRKSPVHSRLASNPFIIQDVSNSSQTARNRNQSEMVTKTAVSASHLKSSKDSVSNEKTVSITDASKVSSNSIKRSNTSIDKSESIVKNYESVEEKDTKANREPFENKPKGAKRPVSKATITSVVKTSGKTKDFVSAALTIEILAKSNVCWNWSNRGGDWSHL